MGLWPVIVQITFFMYPFQYAIENLFYNNSWRFMLKLYYKKFKLNTIFV